MTRMLVHAAVDRRGAGGVQAVVRQLLTGLRGTGQTVFESWSEPGPQPVPGEWDCPLFVRRGADGRPLPGRRTHLPSLARAARGLARRRPAVVNVHFVTEAAYYFLMLRRAFGHRVVLSLHGSDLLRPAAHDRSLLHALLRSADAITAVSDHLCEQVLGLPGIAADRVHRIANGIDTRFWTPAETTPQGHARRIVAVGRLERVKGQDLLLGAFARVHAAYPDARLELIGHGVERDALAAQARRLGIAGQVDFAGDLPAEAVREALRDAAVFVLPSRSEGMPLALIEAMACGAPVVATRVGGVAAVLDDAGLIVPAGSASALADAVLALLADRDRAVGLARDAMARAARFSAQRSVEAYRQLLEQVAAGQSGVRFRA